MPVFAQLALFLSDHVNVVLNSVNDSYPNIPILPVYNREITSHESSRKEPRYGTRCATQLPTFLSYCLYNESDVLPFASCLSTAKFKDTATSGNLA